MNKEEAILILEAAGWIINRPEEITVDKTEEDCIFLSQAGNGKWIVQRSGSVTFFSENESDDNHDPDDDKWLDHLLMMEE